MAADLAFEVGGILDNVVNSYAFLGNTVNAFALDGLYTQLGVAADPSGANLWNSAALLQQVSGNVLMNLRAEGMKADLDKACALRANVYYAKFANQAAIISQFQNYYGPPSSPFTATSKPTLLANLSGFANTQYTQLGNAYKNSGAQSAPTTPSSAPGNLNGRSNVVYASMSALTATTTGTVKPGPNPNTTANSSTDTQTMAYADYAYRYPAMECNAQNTRAQISLQDEQFAQFLAGQYVSNIGSVFANQLNAINMDVKRLQVALLNTILVPPITGVVTAIYKQPGDAVRTGEPVIRVENTNTMLLTGVIIYRGLLAVGTFVIVQANLFSSSASTNITGTIVVARGDPGGDDHWNVVISCPIVAPTGDVARLFPYNTYGNPTLPPDYQFDSDDTVISVGAISVPNVIGENNPTPTIVGVGLTVGTTRTVAGTSALPIVLAQDPPAGTLVPSGFAINLIFQQKKIVTPLPPGPVGG